MNLRVSLVAVAAAFTIISCGTSSGTTGSASQLNLVEVSNGFGLMLPHQTFKPDVNGFPTTELVAIRTKKQLVENVTASNPILPVTEWPVTATLPNGDAGNHFIYAEFSQPIAIDTVLDPSPGGASNSGLIGPITVLALDPQSNTTVPVVGRAFIGGRTYSGTASGSPPQLPLQQWVELDGSGKPVASPVDDGNGNITFPGVGFPGTQSAAGFPGAGKLVQNTTFVFVVDTDGNLATHERFPVGRQIRMRATTAMGATNNEALRDQLLASGTVGTDTLTPEVATTPPPNAVPITTPSFGDRDVDPLTTIRVEFTEPIQPLTLTSLPTGQPPALSSALEIKFGPTTQVTKVPFTGLPVSVYDLSLWEFTPGFAFPGNGPAIQACGTFNRVTIEVVPGQMQDLSSGANLNTQPASTSFTTGEGPGLVNAPVSPDAIYVARTGATPGISVIDLNGFGQGTGNPTFDFTYTTFPKGNSNFPNNPNLLQYGPTMQPPLFAGTCTVDGGSTGAFTLTKDSSLNDLLVRPPIVTSVGEMMIGQPLDLVFNNGRDSTGCRNGGGNFCAVTGKKLVTAVQQTMTSLGPPQPGQIPTIVVPGGTNPISYAPHPNPPALIFPPLCLQPFIGGQEPTSVFTVTPPPVGLGFSNLLVPGSPLGSPLTGTPPSGIPARFQNAYFQGPDLASNTSVVNCLDHMIRQQIGQFLYMIDRGRREVVVFNSNRMTVLDRIPLSDPTDLAMGPQLDFLAVSNQNADSVSFIDINPRSSSFHQVVKTTNVGRGPRGIAWDPGNEDILVCNEQENTVSVLSALSFNVRNVVKAHLNRPFDLVITQRQVGFGFLRGVYFGWIMNRNGNLTIYESGPSGTNGWGYDDTIGVAPFRMDNPKKIEISYNNLGGSVWVLHENPLQPDGTPTGVQGGAITRVDVTSAVFGVLPLTGFNFFVNPNFRDMTVTPVVSIGPNQLTGVPVDMAQDDLNNMGAFPNFFTQYSVGSPILINGKTYVKPVPGTVQAAKAPDFLFAAIPNSSEGPGVVDVISLTSGFTRFDTDAYLSGVQSIPAPGVIKLSDYWRQ